MKKLSKILSSCSFITSFVFVYLGFNKMYVYNNSQYYTLCKNAYVGGDCYNYIINGTYATAFFVLATLFTILGIGILIINKGE